MLRSVLAFALALLVPGAHVASPPPLVVHEWGTITTRHTAAGPPLGRLNRIDSSEVLPAFVHRYEPPATRGDPQRSTTKAPLTPGRPDVTMRLETPVIYFHTPPGLRPIAKLDISVRFRGGVLNEFYPNADASVEVDAERVNAKLEAGYIKSWDGAVLDNYVVGGLQWRGVSLRDSVPLPRTTSPIWLAPRRVRSSGLVTASGESERYVFYRGVAHLDALVQTEVRADGIHLRAPARLLWLRTPSLTIQHMWFVSVRPDGRAAFRDQGRVVIAKGAPSAELARIAPLSDDQHTVGGIGALRRSMKAALVSAGLFDDEAEAMLETWKTSYFGAPGQRLLYIVPSEWTAYFLPLRISVPHVSTRVLVGRIDLLSS